MKAAVAKMLVVTIALLSTIPPSHADLLGWLAGPSIDKITASLNEMAAERIAQILDGFDKTSHSLLDQGTREGNLLLVQGGNEMQLVVASARAQFGSEMDKQLSSAAAELRPFLVELERFQLSVDELKSNAVDMEDLVALDLQDLPFSKSYFGIRRVLGSVLVQNGSDNYRIVLRGPHFGIASSEETITFDAKLNGIQLKGPELGVSPDDAVFNIPADSVKSAFQERSLVTLPMDVTITRDTPKFAFLFGGSHDVIKQTFDISLMPDYAGDMQIVTTRPTYVWKAVLAPERKDKNVISSPATVSYSVANPAVLSSPSPGEQKIDDTIVSVCHSDMRPAWMFPNHRIEFADNPIFTAGWFTNKYIGADPVDWDIATKEVFDTWGISWSTWGHSACGTIDSGAHCHVPASVLLESVTRATKDATGCPQTSLAAPQWSNNHTQVSVDIMGGVAASPSPWSLTFQALSYVQTGSQDDAIVTVPVFASKFTTIDIENPQGTTSKVTFSPSVGKSKQGDLGKDIAGGLAIRSQGVIGTDIQRFEYAFQYP